MKKIIITEKPSVAREYAKVLGVYSMERTNGYIENDEWIITWCVGHLVTLAYPEVYDPDLKNWSMDTLPFLPKNYKYQIISAVKDQFEVVKMLYNRKDIDTIYYAGDPAREGIYIQMLVRQEAGHTPGIKELVVWIDSQTEDEIKRGIKEAKPLNYYQKLADSGYMRAIEDYALGINFSRAFTLKFQKVFQLEKPISVGRVMSTVLGMVVRREYEIRNFQSQSYYKVLSHIDLNGEDLVATWRCEDITIPSSFYNTTDLYNESGFKTKEAAERFIEKIGTTLSIASITMKEEKKYAPLLYNLAELQATCSRLLHISPSETLAIAQELYEAKLTTYPRTKARVLSSAIAKEIYKNLSGLKGYNVQLDTYIQEALGKTGWIEKSQYTDDSQIEDHYAIIPTGQSLSSLQKMSPLAQKVYDLIVRRFISIFMPPAVYKKTAIIEKDKKTGEKFFANGSALIEPGFYSCIGIPTDKNTLPSAVENLSVDEQFQSKYTIYEGETKPPARYTSGSMVLAMENAGNLIENEELRAQIKSCGIGTEATRAETIKKLVQNEYLALNTKTQVLTPAPYGFCIYEILNSVVPSILNPEMTANWEKGLNAIVEGQITTEEYEAKLNNFISKKIKIIKEMPITQEFIDTIHPFIENLPATAKSKSQKTQKVEAECYLSVPYADKDKVKALGAFWDGKHGVWYVPKGKDVTPFKPWISKNGGKSVPKKVYLKVPFDEKDEAKAAGARWDVDAKQWYAMTNMDKSKFTKWL